MTPSVLTAEVTSISYRVPELTEPRVATGVAPEAMVGALFHVTVPSDQLDPTT
jgi:hypothetical protein